MIKLYNVPQYSYIKLISEAKVPPGATECTQGEVYFFDHVDGMYSYCFDRNNEVVHLSASSEVMVVNSNSTDWPT